MAAQNGKWSENDIPEQTGRTVLITGANSGLGLRSAVVLATRGATVLLACRSPERGAQALAQVRAAASGDAPELVRLDLADLASVREAAAKVRERTGDKLELLMNNAGVMATPKGTTADGFETQYGTNHLGHAALTWLLLPALRGGSGARVVTLSSLAANAGALSFTDPNFERRRYSPITAYGQAKLANQSFALELDRRLRAAGEPVISLAAHPGYTHTELASNMAGAQRSAVLRTLMGIGSKISDVVIAQSARMGTLPQLYAATAPGLHGGEYVGPSGFGGTRGYPKVVSALASARNEQDGAALWELTAKLTGVTPDPA